MITLAAPLLALSYKAWVESSVARRRMLVAAGVVSVVIQGLHAIALTCVQVSDRDAVCTFF
jgi:hypothetical protein